MKKTLVFIFAIILAFSATAAFSAGNKSVQTKPKNEKYVEKIVNNGYKYSNKGFFNAIDKGDKDSVLLFLLSGMDANTFCGRTPALLKAIAAEKPEVVSLLLRAGARVDVATKSGNTPVMLAVKHDNAEILKTLIKYRASVNETPKGMLPINVALDRKNAEVIVTLLNAGASVDRKSIAKAARQNNPKLMNYILNQYNLRY